MDSRGGATTIQAKWIKPDLAHTYLSWADLLPDDDTDFAGGGAAVAAAAAAAGGTVCSWGSGVLLPVEEAEFSDWAVTGAFFLPRPPGA